MNNDEVMNAMSAKLAKSSPKQFPWDLVISAIISVLKNCGEIEPAEAKQRLANAGPFLRLQLMRSLKANGVKDPRDAMLAAIKAANDTTDEEAVAFFAIANAVE